MNCPKCNKQMRIMYRPAADRQDEFRETVEVLGTCADCDFDATWIIETVYENPDDAVYEYGLQRYFFG